jgi:hypothetical protein
MVLFYNENGMKRITAIAAALWIGFGPVAHAVSHTGDGDHGCQTCQAIRSPIIGAVVALAVRAHVFAEIVVAGELRMDLPRVQDPSRPRGPPL